MSNITWTGLAQCQRCQKWGELRFIEAVPEVGGTSRRSVLVTFEQPEGWLSWKFCSRRCQLQARLTETVAEKERLEQELEGEE